MSEARYDDYEDFWARKHRNRNRNREERTFEEDPRRRRIREDVPRCSSSWNYFLGGLLLFGLLAWLLYYLSQPKKSTVSAQPQPLPTPFSYPPNGFKPAQSRPSSTLAPQQILGKILEVLRSRLESSKSLTPEQSYIMAPQQLSQWQMVSTQPLVFVFPKDSSGRTPVQRPWELSYDYKTQNVSLSPVESTSTPQPTTPTPDFTIQPFPNPGNTSNTTNGSPDFTIQPYPNPSNVPSTQRPPLNVSEYAFFDPRSKSASPVTPWIMEQSVGNCHSANTRPDYRIFNPN